MKNFELDIMPRDKALAMLTDPKLKLTAAFRKECKRALDRPAYSVRTILGDNRQGYRYTTDKPKHPMDRLAAKCRDVSIGVLSLSKWCRRAAKRTRHALGLASRVEDDPTRTAELTDYALAQAGMCVALRDAIKFRVVGGK